MSAVRMYHRVTVCSRTQDWLYQVQSLHSVPIIHHISIATSSAFIINPNVYLQLLPRSCRRPPLAPRTITLPVNRIILVRSNAYSSQYVSFSKRKMRAQLTRSSETFDARKNRLLEPPTTPPIVHRPAHLEVVRQMVRPSRPSLQNRAAEAALGPKFRNRRLPLIKIAREPLGSNEVDTPQVLFDVVLAVKRSILHTTLLTVVEVVLSYVCFAGR